MTIQSKYPLGLYLLIQPSWNLFNALSGPLQLTFSCHHRTQTPLVHRLDLIYALSRDAHEHADYCCHFQHYCSHCSCSYYYYSYYIAEVDMFLIMPVGMLMTSGLIWLKACAGPFQGVENWWKFRGPSATQHKGQLPEL